MKRAPRSRQRHDLYAKYHDYDSEISDLLGECGLGCACGQWPEVTPTGLSTGDKHCASECNKNISAKASAAVSSWCA
jgi:hypothetical protein